MGVWVSRRVLWLVCVCIGRIMRPLAGRGFEMGDGYLGFCVGLWFAGCWRLLVCGARGQGPRLGGWQVVVVYPVCKGRWHVLAFVLIVCMHGPLRVYGGVWRPDYCGPVLRGQQVVLGRVVMVRRFYSDFNTVCLLCLSCCLLLV